MIQDMKETLISENRAKRQTDHIIINKRKAIHAQAVPIAVLYT